MARVQKSLGRLEMLKAEVHYYASIDSTQNKAKELAEAGAPEGTVVIAGVQRRGRGRLGKAWASPKGGLWISLVLRPRLNPAETPTLGLAAAYALTKCIGRRHGLNAGIRWPNDVLIGERKVAGILLEAEFDGTRVRHSILGVGVNVDNSLNSLPSELRVSTTTIRREAGRRVGLAGLTAAFLEEFDQLYSRMTSEGLHPLVDEMRGCVRTIGRKVKVVLSEGEFQGVASGLTPDGRMVMKLRDGGVKLIGFGDVYELREDEAGSSPEQEG